MPADLAAPIDLPETVRRLDDLFEALRRRDRQLSVSQRERIRVRALLLRLAEQGRTPESFADLAGWIAPLIASDASQQRLVRDVCLELEPVKKPPRPDDPGVPRRAAGIRATKRPHDPPWWQRPLIWVPAAAALVAALAVWFLVIYGGAGEGTQGSGVADAAEAAVSNEPAPSLGPLSWMVRALPVWLGSQFGAASAVRIALALLPVLLAVWMVRRLVDRVPTFTREKRQPDEKAALELRRAKRDLFQSPRLREHLSKLKLRKHFATGNIEPRETVERAIRRLGLVTEVFYRTRYAAIGHLVFVDRLTESDHLGAIGDMLIERMRDADAPVVGYDLQHDPSRVTACGASLGAGTTVHDLRSIGEGHVGDCAVIVAPAERLVDPLTGSLSAWLDQLEGINPVCLMTPVPEKDWGRAEKMLIEAGIAVFPASEAGVEKYAERTAVVSELGDDAPPLSPPRISKGRRTIDIHDSLVFGPAPEPAAIEEILYELNVSLSPRAFELLQAVAVFPAMDPELTIHLGRNLKLGGEPLLDENSLAELSRLAWLRHSYMPYWLRVGLISAMSESRAEETHRLLVAYQEAQSGVTGLSAARVLEFGVSNLDMVSWLRRLTRDKDETAPERDTLFLRFMQREKITLADVEAKGDAAAVLQQGARRDRLLVLAAGTIASVVVLLAGAPVAHGIIDVWQMLAVDAVVAIPDIYVTLHPYLVLGPLFAWVVLQWWLERREQGAAAKSVAIKPVLSAMRVYALLLALTDAFLVTGFYFYADDFWTSRWTGEVYFQPPTGFVSSLTLVAIASLNRPKRRHDILDLARTSSPGRVAGMLLSLAAACTVFALAFFQDAIELELPLPSVVGYVAAIGLAAAAWQFSSSGDRVVAPWSKLFPFLLLLPVFVAGISLNLEVVAIAEEGYGFSADLYKAIPFCSVILLSIAAWRLGLISTHYVLFASVFTFGFAAFTVSELFDLFLIVLMPVFFPVISGIPLLMVAPRVRLNPRMRLNRATVVALLVAFYTLVATFLLAALVNETIFAENPLVVLIGTAFASLLLSGSVCVQFLLLHLVQKPASEIKAGSATALWFIPLLWLACAHYPFGDEGAFAIVGAVPPIAAWMGWKFGRWGLVAVVVGCLPLALGATFGPVIFSGDFGLFLLSVALARIAAEKDRLRRYLEADRLTWQQFLFVVLGLTLALDFAAIGHPAEFSARHYVVFVLAMIGLSAMPLSGLAVGLTLVAAAGLFLPSAAGSLGFLFDDLGGLWLPAFVLYVSRAMRMRLVGDSLPMGRSGRTGVTAIASLEALFLVLLIYAAQTLPLLEGILNGVAESGLRPVNVDSALFAAFCLGLLYGRKGAQCAIGVYALIEIAQVALFLADGVSADLTIGGSVGLAAWGWMGWVVRRETIGLRTLVLPAPRANAERLWRTHSGPHPGADPPQSASADSGPSPLRSARQQIAQ